MNKCMRLVYDIECNGLDPDTIWCIVAYDLNTGTEYAFSDHDNLHGSISDGVALLGRSDLLIGHNILDLIVEFWIGSMDLTSWTTEAMILLSCLKCFLISALISMGSLAGALIWEMRRSNSTIGMVILGKCYVIVSKTSK